MDYLAAELGVFGFANCMQGFRQDLSNWVCKKKMDV